MTARRPPMSGQGGPPQQTQPQQQRSRGGARGGRGGGGRGRGGAVPQGAVVSGGAYPSQQQQVQIGQQAAPSGAQGQPRKRPPVKRNQNTAMMAQFNAPSQQQQQQQVSVPVPLQQQQAPQRQAPRQVQQPVPQQPQVSNLAAAPEQAVEEKQEILPSTAGGALSSGQAQQTQASVMAAQQAQDGVAQKLLAQPKAPARHQPPWLEFTGDDKPQPQTRGWAHRVRQVLSADTLKIALLKERNLKPLDQLRPPKIIQFTLEGIIAPRCQRYDASLERKKAEDKSKKPKKKKDQSKDKDGDKEKSSKDDGDDKATASKDASSTFVYQPLEEDEPFAYEAREFVRKQIMNKNIFYACWRQQTSAATRTIRYYGDIYYQDKSGQTLSLTTEVVAAGYAKLKEGGPKVLSAKEKERLQKKQNDAASARKGIHSYDANEDLAKPHVRAAVRDISWVAYEDQERFGQQFIGKTLRGVVDQVISGSTLRVELVTDAAKSKFANIVVNMAGVNAPKVPSQYSSGKKKEQDRRKKADELLSTKFGEAAREWSEERLLGQVVDVRFLLVSNKQIIAQILHDKGRIGPSLLKKGLAQYESWSAKKCDAEEQKLLKQATEIARKNRALIWNFIDSSASKRNEEMAVVTQVVSGDTLMLETADGTEDRFTLSSIRAPRLGVRIPRRREAQAAAAAAGKGKKGKKAGSPAASLGYEVKPDEYLAREAKEFVRERCIGKKVKLIHEYTRKMTDPNNKNRADSEKKFASIYIQREKGKDKGTWDNLALLLIRNGLADLVIHGKAETDRSEEYADLEQEWNKQREAKTGLFAFLYTDKHKGNFIVRDQKKREKEAEKNQIQDYSGINERNIKARDLITLNQYLKEKSRKKGVIEFVFGANRVKVYIPSKNVCIAVRLADIRVGDYNLDQSQDPIREKAKKWLNRNVLQRDIELEITSTGQETGQRFGGRRKGGQATSGTQTSRNPNYDGHIFLNGVNIAEEFLRNGWAQVIQRRSNEDSRYRNQPSSAQLQRFRALEKEAQDGQQGIWAAIQQADGDDLKNEAQIEQRLKQSKTGEEVEVVVSHIETPTMFYVNMASSDDMQKMTQAMEKLAASKPTPPKKIGAAKGVKYAAMYDQYYARVRVKGRDRRRQQQQQQGGNNDEDSGRWFVLFVDYGNKASVSRNQFALLPEELRLDRVPALAQQCRLAGINVYTKDANAYNSAGYFFSSYAFQSGNQKLKMKILYDDQYSKTWHVELFVGDQSLNQLIASQGYVLLARDQELPREIVNKAEFGQAWSDEHKTYVEQYFDAIKANIDAAKNSHQGIFLHGDVEDDEDDNLNMPRKK